MGGERCKLDPGMRRGEVLIVTTERASPTENPPPGAKHDSRDRGGGG